MSSIDVYPIESIPPEPWRNGGGMTRTIATAGAQWRVSLASIERNGPYSRFPDNSRISLILTGNGVTLTGHEAVVQLRPLVAREYDGDADWDATLIDGPSMALNVMTVKGRYVANVRPVDQPAVVPPGCPAIAVALNCGFTFSEGLAACSGEVIPGSVLVSEHHGRPLRLAARLAGTGEARRKPYAVLVTIEPAPVRKLT
ncbi:TPA: HutD family protein [Burkholderia vietnamiensis]|nr:HutD family protein [Burkholderia vietnamiensis]